jgi:hypothetical protein
VTSALVLRAAALVVAGAATESAPAAPWCGPTKTQNRRPALAGRSMRVVLAFPLEARRLERRLRRAHALLHALDAEGLVR